MSIDWHIPFPEDRSTAQLLGRSLSAAAVLAPDAYTTGLLRKLSGRFGSDAIHHSVLLQIVARPSGIRHALLQTYLRLLQLRARDLVIEQVCDHLLKPSSGEFYGLSELRLASAATLMWHQHATAFRALGSSRREFFRELHRVLSSSTAEAARISSLNPVFR